MTLPAKLPQFQDAPAEYDPDYLNRLLSALEMYILEVNATGLVRASNFTAEKMPSAGYGLRVGQFFEQNGVVYVVRAKDIFFASVPKATTALGTVTTSP